MRGPEGYAASGGLSTALAAMHETYLTQAAQVGIPNEVLHRVASMASGGMDTLPHNGAIITLLVVTGLTHKKSYKGHFGHDRIQNCRGIFHYHFVLPFWYSVKLERIEQYRFEKINNGFTI